MRTVAQKETSGEVPRRFLLPCCALSLKIVSSGGARARGSRTRNSAVLRQIVVRANYQHCCSTAQRSNLLDMVGALSEQPLALLESSARAGKNLFEFVKRQ